MAPAFSKEAILIGAVDYLCLVCERYLSNKYEVSQHITTSGHRENFETTTYIEKLKNDRIRRVNKWYFCEFCNVLLSTKSIVNLHVEEAKHNENKLSKMIERVGDFVIVFGNVAINSEAWHGLIENTCIICNVEFDKKEKKEDHKKETIHAINLIQSTISGTDENIYRKVIWASTFHCLICNDVVADISTHFNDTQHRNLLQRCREIIPQIQENYLSAHCTTESLNNNESIKDDDGNTLSHLGSLENKDDGKNIVNTNAYIDNKSQHNVKIDKDHENVVQLMQQKPEDIKGNENNNKETFDITFDNVPKFQQNNIYINFESHTAVCKRCSTSLELKNQVIEQHIEEHKNSVQKPVPLFKIDLNDKKRDDKTLFTSPMYLKHRNPEKNECSATKSAEAKIGSYKAAEEHNLNNYIDSPNNNPDPVGNEQGTSLKNTEKIVDTQTSKSNKITMNMKQVKKCHFKRVHIGQFVRDMAIVSTSGDIFMDCILNKQYCISQLSIGFFTIVVDGTGFWCYSCDVKVSHPDVDKHLKSDNHKSSMDRALIIIHPGSEFIREIRPNTFHCGFCNIVKNSWEGMEDHMDTTDHKESKTFASWRAVQYQRELKQSCDTQEQFSNDYLLKHLTLR